MRNAVSRELHAYWKALKEGRPAPERNEIDPAAIRTILADTFVLEFNVENGFPFRISGSRINALFRSELRGQSFLKLWRETDRREIESILKRVADKAQPCLLGGEARPSGMTSLPIEVTLLPLFHHGAAHSRILGSVSAGDGAEWFGLIGAGPATLTSVNTLDPEAPRQGARPAPVSFLERKGRGASRSGRFPGVIWR